MVEQTTRYGMSVTVPLPYAQAVVIISAVPETS